MAYTINKYNGDELIVLEDGTIDTTTSLGLVGRNYVGYGETQNENFVFLLENFANPEPPTRPLEGQTWFDTDSKILNVYDGNVWHPLGAAVVSNTEPTFPADGELWLKTPINQLFVYQGGLWKFIGPEDVEGFGGPTRCRAISILGSDNVRYPAIALTIAGNVIGIISQQAFTINPSEPIAGFDNLTAGLTMSTLSKVKGNLEGLADRATRLETLRTINGIGFDGTSNIVIRSSTTSNLIRGDYLVGPNFDGSTPTTWSVDATSSNVIGKVVARNSSGGFAAGTITADLVGDVTGNVTASSGVSTFDEVRANRFVGPTLSGNADSASRLQTARKINNVFFDGTADITVSANAETLTGGYINPGVSQSNLTSVGTLVGLNIADPGVNIGSGSQFKLFLDTGSVPTIRTAGTNKKLKLTISDNGQPGGSTDISFIPGSDALFLGGLNAPALIPDTENVTNLGHPGAKWNKVYANNLVGNADTATLATTSNNLSGGAAGAIPYQTATGATAMVPAGIGGQVLVSQGSGAPIWSTAFVTGMIMQWYGLSTAIPSGWALCDGTNGTPDLRNKFVIGAGGTYTNGATGGSTTTSVTITGTTAAGGSHNHGGTSGSTTLTASQLPNHTHDFYDVYGIWGDQPGNYNLVGGVPTYPGGATPAWYSGLRDADGNFVTPYFYYSNATDGDYDGGAYAFKNRTLPNSGFGGGGHNHTIPTEGTHTHTVSGSGTGTNLPPYVALFYIMKL